MADQIFYGYFSLHPFDSDFLITELTTLHDHQLLCFYEIRWAGLGISNLIERSLF